MMTLTKVRIVALAVAGLLAVFSTWDITTTLVSPPPNPFPGDATEAAALESRAPAAHRAAEVCFICGETWTESALVDAAPALFAATDSDPARSQRALHAVHNAIRFAPHDTRAWALLADLTWRRNATDPQIAEALRVSYYMGPNELSLAPLRLMVAGQITADEELRDQIVGEIQRIGLSNPTLRPAVVAAHQRATPAGKRLFEDALKDVDATLLPRTP